MPITYSEISRFWTEHPCFGGNRGFPFWYWKDKKVLEIGCGGGVDAVNFINNKAQYTGIDLTDEAVRLTKMRVGETGKVLKMNAEFLDFPNEYFDLVYSFGVLHHTLSPEKAIQEIYRVLKPGGFIFIMVYNKLSFRYLIEIKLLRRVLWFFRYHKFNKIRKTMPHPTREEWVSMNTDDIGCPMARAYTLNQVKDLLHQFKITSIWTENWGWFRMVIGRK